nr:RNA-directed DNA polymerase, eukaryota, reverse transcriptase zinc-binding domain protein [Tanacetum cinerariifolium]
MLSVEYRVSVPASLLDTPEACQDLVDHAAPPGYFSELCHMHNDDFFGQYNINLAWQVAMGPQLRLRFEQEAKLLRKSVAQVARREQRIQAQESEIKSLEALLETEADMKRAAEEKSAGLSQELERMRAQFSELQVSNERLSQQVDALQQQAAFEDYKRKQDQMVEQRCEEMDARLDAMSIDFDEELVKWEVEGDGNSKFFHGLINSRRKCQMVEGIMLDRVWNSESHHFSIVDRDLSNPWYLWMKLRRRFRIVVVKRLQGRMITLLCSLKSFAGIKNLIDVVGITAAQVYVNTTLMNGPHDTQYCMEDPEQAFVEYRSLHTNEARGFFGVSVTKLATDRLVNGSSCDGIDMVIKDLDLEPKVDAIMRDFCSLKVYYLPPALSVCEDAYSTKVVSEQDDLPSSVELGFFGVSITKLATDQLVNGSSCDRIDMVIKDLDLEPKWKELSKGTSSNIFPCGGGSCSKKFKPVASLIAKGNLNKRIPKSVECASVLNQPDGVGSKRYHIVLYEELNGIPVSFVARFEVISKGMDRIRVSRDG